MTAIGLTLACWAPAVIFMMFLAWGTGGEQGGMIVLILGFLTVFMGLPWNIALTWLWGILPNAYQHPPWLGNGEWAGFAIFIVASVAGCVINGLLLGWLAARSKRLRESKLA